MVKHAILKLNYPSVFSRPVFRHSEETVTQLMLTVLQKLKALLVPRWFQVSSQANNLASV